MDPRIAIIRFYALCLAALACVVVWPAVGVGLWPLVFFFPGCVCCGEFDCGLSSPVCNSGTAPVEVTLEISGITGTCGGATPCSSIDGAYVIDNFTDDIGRCSYARAFSPRLCPSDAQAIFAMGVQLVRSGSDVDISANFSGLLGGTAVFSKDNHASVPADCNAFGTVALTLFSDTHTNCDFSTATCDVTL